MICSKCKAVVPDDSVFCFECGSKIESIELTEYRCPNCGKELKEENNFCENCGAKAVKIEAKKTAKREKTKTKKAGSVVKIGVLASVILVIVAAVFIFRGTSGNHYAVYIKDAELQYMDLTDTTKKAEFTSKLADGAENSELRWIAYNLDDLVKTGADGKRLFYPDKTDYTDYGSVSNFTLYYRNINNLKKEAVKLDSNVVSYTINEKGTLVTYIKDDKLYQHDLTEKTKIASDVASGNYRVSADGKTLVYLTIESGSSGNLYIKKSGKDAEKISSNVTGLRYVNEDCSYIVYMKDDSLYVKKGKDDAQKVSSNVAEVISVYESGEIYYTKPDESVITAWELVKDDCVDKDDTYLSVAEQLKTMELNCYSSLGLCSLCFYDGKESTVLTETMVYYDGVAAATEEAAIVYYGYEDDELPKISLSELINKYGTSSGDYIISEYLGKDRVSYVAHADSVMEIELDDISISRIADDGSTVYVGADYNSADQTVSLYQIIFKNGEIKSTAMVDEGVYIGSYYIIGTDSVLYFKEVEGSTGELYVDKVQLDDDASIYLWEYDVAGDELYYTVDVDSNTSQGTLKCYNGKEAIEIADEVYTWSLTSGGEVLFLYDYNADRYKGELWAYNGKKTIKLDDDVVEFVLID